MEKFKLRARRREIESSLITTVPVTCYQLSNPLAHEDSRNRNRVFLPEKLGEAKRRAARISLAMARKEEKEFYEHAMASIPTIKIPMIGIQQTDRWSRASDDKGSKKEYYFELGYITDSLTKRFFSLKYKSHSYRRQFNARGFASLLQPPTIGNLAFWYLGDSPDGSTSSDRCGAFKINGNSLLDIVRAFNLIPNGECKAQSNLMIIPPPIPGAEEEIHEIIDVNRVNAVLPAPPSGGSHPTLLTGEGYTNSYKFDKLSINFTFNQTFLPLLNVWLKTHAPKVKTTTDMFYSSLCDYWKAQHA